MSYISAPDYVVLRLRTRSRRMQRYLKSQMAFAVQIHGFGQWIQEWSSKAGRWAPCWEAGTFQLRQSKLPQAKAQAEKTCRRLPKSSPVRPQKGCTAAGRKKSKIQKNYHQMLLFLELFSLWPEHVFPVTLATINAEGCDGRNGEGTACIHIRPQFGFVFVGMAAPWAPNGDTCSTW
jgi:hypothetical protein